MSYANGTTHYNLPQTVGTDKRDWFDTNSAFAAVDAALYAAATGQASDAEAIAALQQTVGGQATDITVLQTLTGQHTSQIAALNTTVNNLSTEVSDVRQDSEDMITANNEGAAATSTKAYSAGNYFIYNDVLYKATTSIAVGDTIVPNTNCTATNVDTELTQLNSDLTGTSTNMVLANGFEGSALKIEVGNLVVVSFSTYNNNLAINAGDSYEILDVGSPCAHTRNIVGAVNGTIVVCSVSDTGKVTIVPRGGDIPAGTFISGEIVTLKS